MPHSLRRTLAFGVSAVTVMAAGPALTALQAGAESANSLRSIKHIVVIYEENHSFDNLYGGWPGVNGRSNAGATLATQVDQSGNAYTCLLQNDLNLKVPPLTATPPCTTSHFLNKPFSIEQYIPPSATTCPAPGGFFLHGSLPDPVNNLPGGCTEDIVHRYYQEQYQLNSGAQNRYVTGSDAQGLTMGYYDTTQLPIYQYLHGDNHPDYAIADAFFQSAFGGSFLNHQWLIAARTPVDTLTIPASQRTILDANGMPTSYPPLYSATAPKDPTKPIQDKSFTQQCGQTSTQPNFVCGDYAVNTIQPSSQPYSSAAAFKLPALTTSNIGDELTNAHVSWAWYSGGWDNAAGNVGGPGWTNGTTVSACSDPASKFNGTKDATHWYCPNKVFQFHHQPFNYYANYQEGGPGRGNLQDEQAFFGLANSSDKTCKLPSVSFVKPIGLENEHPGYTSETKGSDHLVQLLSSIQDSACAKNTMVVVTYDEFGGQWDHVAPPGQGGKSGAHDVWGPGTRVPALILAPHLHDDFVVDSTQYDTTSILATIEHRYGLAPLSTRDASVNDLGHVFAARQPSDNQDNNNHSG
jgi:acid phosphatase